MQQYIGVFTVCISTCFGASSIQRGNPFGLMNFTISSFGCSIAHLKGFKVGVSVLSPVFLHLKIVLGNSAVSHSNVYGLSTESILIYLVCVGF